MTVSSGVLVLLLISISLVGFAYYQARDFFWGDKDWQRELRRHRRFYFRRIPLREQLSVGTKCLSIFNRLSIQGIRWKKAVEEITSDREDFPFRVRDEIDRMVGKEEYHGQKEQL